ncbi:MAG: carboxypeptidase regulatory-like domain-containing protein [Planctomycetaceae bacterium]|nr:carboxypeptidase regulatory-like domain-containing protein [Planctomycetaceae bacterium]
MFRQLCGFSLSLLLTVFATGCGSGVPSDRPDLATVTGTVTLDGQPLEGADVTFQPESARPSVGTTDSSGKYELIYLNDVKGAVVGPNRVMITTRRDGADDDPSSNVPERLPKKYHAESTLSADVEAGSNVFDFDLTSE